MSSHMTGTLMNHPVIPADQVEQCRARGGLVSTDIEQKSSTTLCVYCYEVPAPVYVDGKTNIGSDGELLDRVVEEDRYEHAAMVGVDMLKGEHLKLNLQSPEPSAGEA